MKISKKIQYGDLVIRKGDKLIRASKRNKNIAGFILPKEEEIYMDLRNDKIEIIRKPDRLSIKGIFSVKESEVEKL